MRGAYIVREPDPPELWVLYLASGRRVGQYETREGAEQALARLARRQVQRRTRGRRAATFGALVLFLALVLVVIAASARGEDPPPPVPPTYAGLTAEQWAAVAAANEVERDRARRKLARRERELQAARRQVERLRRAMRARVSLAGAGAGTRGLLCIHQYERGAAGWATNTGNGYYGGLQMDLAFQRAWGGPFLREYGTADRWPMYVQVAVALAAYTERGFSPWPNTRRACGI